MKKKTFLTQLHNYEDIIIQKLNRFYMEYLKDNWKIYRKLNKQKLLTMIKMCNENGWDVFEYFKFQLSFFKGIYPPKMENFISDRAKRGWIDYLKGYLGEQKIVTHKQFQRRALSERLYIKEVLKKIHGDADWIDKLTGIKDDEEE